MQGRTRSPGASQVDSGQSEAVAGEPWGEAAVGTTFPSLRPSLRTSHLGGARDRGSPVERSRAGRAGRRGVGIIGGGKAPQTRSRSGGGLPTLQPLRGRSLCWLQPIWPLPESEAFFSLAAQQSEWKRISGRELDCH